MSGYIRSKPDVSWWLTQVRKGIDYRKKYAKEEQWDMWRSYYRGNWRPGIMPSNIYFKMLRTVVPRVYFRNPSVSITSARPGLVNMAFAQLLERVDNKMMRQMKMKQTLKMAVQKSFMFGTGVVKLGFGAEFTPNLPPGFSVTEPVGNNGQVFEYNDLIRDNMPWVANTHTGNFIVPAGAEDMHSSRWVGEWFRRPLDDVKADPRLKHTKNLTASSRSRMDHPGMVRKGVKPYTDMIDLVEIRDKQRQRVMVLAPYATDRVLLDDDDELQLNGTIPYYDLIFNTDEEVFWGVPDSVNLDYQQREMNEIKTQIMKHRRLALVKMMVKQGTLSDEDAAKMVSEDVMPFVTVKGEPSTDVVLREGSIPSDLFVAENDLHRDIQETMGFGRNQFGEYAEGSADRTAHEAEIVKMASEIRVDERRDMVADMIVDIISDMNAVLFRHWTHEEVVDIVGPMGVQLWVRFTPAMLQKGQYEVKVDPDSSLPETKALREQKAIQMYQLLKENPLIDPIQLTQYLLHEIHGVQFDSMMRGIPQGAGTQQQPLDVGQYVNLMQNVGQQAPQALPGAA